MKNQFGKKKKRVDPFQKGQFDFKRAYCLDGGNFVYMVNPFKDFTKSREWERGFNLAYYRNLNNESETRS